MDAQLKDAQSNRRGTPSAPRLPALALTLLAGALLSSGCGPLRDHHTSLSTHGDTERGEQHAKSSDLDLLLGIHRLAGVLMGDVALRTERDQIRMRVSEPLTLERYYPGKRVPFTEQNDARNRLRELLEHAFAERVQVLPAGTYDHPAPATHILEATVTKVRAGVQIEFHLLTAGDRVIAGSARGVVRDATLSLVTREQEHAEIERFEVHEPAKENDRLWIMTPPSTSSAEPLPPAPSAPGEQLAAAESTVPANRTSPTVAAPSGHDHPRPATSSAPAWIQDILSAYSGPTEP